VDACFEGDWSDARAAADLARGSDVVTLEIEQVSLACLDAAAQYAPVRPSRALLQIIQDRILQKDWLRDHGFPVGRYRAVASEEDLQQAASELGGICFVKTARGGYDGRGQAKIGFDTPRRPVADEAREAWLALGERPCVVEQALDLEKEISVMVARTPGGEIRSFASATNHHENQILVWSVIPSSISAELELEAQQMAFRLAEEFQLEGLLAVEMFLTKQGELLLNELAPRPHNSYHASERACVTSQFEQAVRAVCDLPLGDVSVVQPAAIANLLGDIWLKGNPRFDLALAIPGVRLHLYEKHQPRKGRKMGHLSAVGATPEDAITRVQEAERRL
jgi:5-(carboxyamino)imidazole ribonucleotide synthase